MNRRAGKVNTLSKWSNSWPSTPLSGGRGRTWLSWLYSQQRTLIRHIRGMPHKLLNKEEKEKNSKSPMWNWPSLLEEFWEFSYSDPCTDVNPPRGSSLRDRAPRVGKPKSHRQYLPRQSDSSIFSWTPNYKCTRTRYLHNIACMRHLQHQQPMKQYRAGRVCSQSENRRWKWTLIQS